MSEGPKPWYETLFGEEYLRVYSSLLTPERTAREVEGIVGLLGIAPGARVLDLCCGQGRHAIPLALRGYRVTGLDLSETLLDHARAEAARLGAAVRWAHGDASQLPFVEEFDAVINVFTSFGYFESDDENQAVLAQVYKALRPGGLFLLDLMHRDALMRYYQPYGVTHGEGGTLITEERRFDQLRGRSHVHVTLILADGRRSEHDYSMRAYTPSELATMFARAGLEVAASYGGLDGSSLTLESRRLVMLGRRPPV